MKKLASVFAIILSTTLLSAAATAADGAALCVQQQLNALGFDAGPADGVIGGRSIAAGEEYRAHMRARSPGWAQPALSSRQAAHWCEKVAEAHPKVAKYWKAYQSASMAPSAQLAGTWRVDVTCRDFKQVNTLRIKRADATTVLGTTNVENGQGNITGGSVQGSKFTFTNTYRWEGKNYTETWSGSLSRGDSYIKGSFKTTHTAAGGCRFAGPRR